MMIIVMGPGFCGTNAIVKFLMDNGYNMGEQWCTPRTLRETPYPIYEDAELTAITQLIITLSGKGAQGLTDLFLVEPILSLALNRRQTLYKDAWGFKVPNVWYPILMQIWVSIKNVPVKFIAGMRNHNTLISRMTTEWEGFNRALAEHRLREYGEILRQLITEFKAPVLKVEQQELLNNPTPQHKRILEFVNAD